MNLNNELFEAARYGNIIRVKVLLKLGADVHTGNNEALRWAASNGHKDVCEVLLKHGANIHALNNNALWFALISENKDVCKLLIKYGADVNNALKDTEKIYGNGFYNQIKDFLMQVKNELK